MASQNRDEILSNFIAITNCPAKEARQFLEAANWNEQAAMDFFFDSGPSQDPAPTFPNNTRSSIAKPTETAPGKPSSSERNKYDSDDDLLQPALEESLRIKPPEKSSIVIPERPNAYKSIVSSKINTVDSFRQNDDESDEEGEAYYAGGSERSGQQIIGPPKPKDNDKKITQVFEAARKQGAKEADDDDDDDESYKKKEKPFAGAGYSLGDTNSPSRTQNQPSVAAPPARAEQLPLRFYSNGFTVGDGELRKFEDNKEFMEYIKRGEVPPELRTLNTGGRQVEVRLEDHRTEEYKRVGPTFKPFGGAGHAVGLSGSGQVPLKLSDDTSASPDLNRLEQIAERRLKTTPSSTTIRLRLPDISTPIRIQIDLHRTLGDVRRFLNENVPSLQSNTFEFLEPPATKIKREDEKRKISDAKLSNSTIAVRRVA